MASDGRNDDNEAAPFFAEIGHSGHSKTDLKVASVEPVKPAPNSPSRWILQWLRNNIKILGLTALLLGGVIALIVSIGCEGFHNLFMYQ